ncbi:MAG: CaiB/BaiF CoA transferase family protein [Candidatus Binatia bacterium]
MPSASVPTARPRPLEGVRVADFSHVLAGPFCTRILADLGADVVKIETPEGDLSRRLGERRGGISGYFMQQNCGKRNVSVDLRRPEGRCLAADLAACCDVVVENFRPGVMDGLGLGQQALRGRNPRLVYCSISGFGHDSPQRSERAFAGVVHAATGIIDRQARAFGREPVDSVFAVGDTVTGLQAALAIVAALHLRQTTGMGQFIDMAMHDALLALQEAANFVLFGGRETDYLCAWTYPCGDRHVVIPADPRANWDILTRLMERPELAAEQRYDSYPKRAACLPELEAHVAAWVAAQPDAETAVAGCHALGLAAARVQTLGEALGSEQVKARRMTVPCDDRSGGLVPVLNSPYRFSDAEAGVGGRPAYRGEDNEEVLTAWLGLSGPEVERLEEAGVLSHRVPEASP